MNTEIRLLAELHNQIESIQTQLNYGIIDATDVADEIMRITKKERRLKEKLVFERHLNRDGTPRKISYHESTPDYPDGYYYTRLDSNTKLKRVSYDAIIDALLAHYGITLTDTTVAGVWEQALDARRRISTSIDETFDCLQRYYERYIDSNLASRDIRTITVDDISEYTNTLVTNNNMTKHNYADYKCVLNILFGYALRRSIITTNPVQAMDNAEYKKMCSDPVAHAEQKILSNAEIMLLQNAIEQRKHDSRYHGYYVYGYMIRLSIETGMRAGELCTLRWSDISDNDIHIHTQQRELKKPLRYVELPWTKDEKGCSKGGRYFPLTDKIIQILDELKENQKMVGVSSEFVFCCDNGEWVQKKNFEKALHTICEACNLPKTNNHALRMALNSNVFIPLGIPVTERARLLGHSVAVNEKFYSFERKDYVERARTLLNNAIVPRQYPENVIIFKKESHESSKFATFQ